jgi:prepilin-type N-terminal cleavage/methylation domain-containing protein
LRTPLPWTRLRSGMTLIEIMAALAIVMVIMVAAVPTLQGVFDIQQRGAARELAQTWTWLRDEAALRNVSFRLVFNLDRNTWKIEVGDPDTVVYGSPEERIAAEEAKKDAMSRFTKRELTEGIGEAEDLEEETNPFTGLEDPAFKTEQELPSGTVFLYVYTPQYGAEGMRPTEDGPPEEAEKDHIAYAHIFPDGTAEHAIVRIVDADDPEDGWSVEVEPLTGRVRIDSDLVDPSQSFSWLPEDPPELH